MYPNCDASKLITHHIAERYYGETVKFCAKHHSTIHGLLLKLGTPNTHYRMEIIELLTDVLSFGQFLWLLKKLPGGMTPLRLMYPSWSLGNSIPYNRW